MLVRRGGQLSHELVYVPRPVLRIPSLAIHLNREIATEGMKVNAQNHLPPVLATAVKAALAALPGDGGAAAPKVDGPPLGERHHPLLLELLATELGCAPGDIADFDLQLCDTQPAVVGGALSEFIFSGRLDNLASCYTSLRAFIDASASEAALADETCVRMVAHFDHEEVGSASAHGAGSPCMLDAIRRVAASLAGGQEGAVERALRASFLVSADMAHAVHANYADRHDACHAPHLHAGLVVKHNANQRYATDGVTAFLFRELGRAAGVPFQVRQRAGGTRFSMPTYPVALRYSSGVCGALRPGLRLHHRPHHRCQHRHARRGLRRAHAEHAQHSRDVRLR